ncbi:hypothetical protein BLNAU_21845 [Blattamonas nauphoetae]|uniref:Uncharacterized protein n=1 Tax=Blattamonas nauphoetae TaxID=2049346 RepID=A0ABQ9WUQ1_9EUKA|nr:hypothetical protein BLNAU_21845 [Blattamonas nauphoetae]
MDSSDQPRGGQRKARPDTATRQPTTPQPPSNKSKAKEKAKEKKEEKRVSPPKILIRRTPLLGTEPDVLIFTDVIEIVQDYVKCSGRAFGSLVRVHAVGCGVSVYACNFTSCVTSVWFGSVCGEGGIAGGGCVVVEIQTRRRSHQSMAASLVDLSSSLFSDCVLLNTDSTHSMSTSDWTCVGGGGFMIVGGEKGWRVDLRLVGIVGCRCKNMGSDWNGWSGGVVVGKGSAVHLDRRGMIAEQNGFGVVVLRQLM